MSHWILKGVNYEFICENTNEWDPHPVSMTNTEIVVEEYHTLAALFDLSTAVFGTQDLSALARR
jgi:hypothetical protein